MKDLYYPVILDVNWWRIHDARPCLMSRSLVINIPYRECIYLHMIKEEDIKEGKLSRIALIAAKAFPEIPECINHLADVFNQEQANRLPLHSKFDFEFKLTVDLININSPLYPLTLPEEDALEAWID